MKLKRPLTVSLLALGLAGTLTAAANASGFDPEPDPPALPAPTATGCPAPDEIAVHKVDTVEVRDGKIYHNGKEVGSLPKGDGPLKVAVKGGKVYVGEEAEALPEPPVTRKRVRAGEAGGAGKAGKAGGAGGAEEAGGAGFGVPGERSPAVPKSMIKLCAKKK